jgi:hypothetical protein
MYGLVITDHLSPWALRRREAKSNLTIKCATKHAPWGGEEAAENIRLNVTLKEKHGFLAHRGLFYIERESSPGARL